MLKGGVWRLFDQEDRTLGEYSNLIADGAPVSVHPGRIDAMRRKDDEIDVVG